MNFLKDMLTPAAPALSSLLPILIIFVVFIHVFVVSVLLLSEGLSLALRQKDKDLSEKFSALFHGQPLTLLLFTVLPLLMMAPLYRLAFFEAGLHIEQYLLVLLVILAAGLGALFLNRKRALLPAGALGVTLLAVYIFLLSALLSLFLFPEKWPFLKDLFPYPLFSITPVFTAGLLISAAFINTGASLGFIYLNWGERRLPEQSRLAELVTIWGRWLVLAGALILPPVLFLFLYTLPVYSMGNSVFPAAVFVLLFTVLSAWAVIPGKNGKGVPLFAFASALLLTLSISVMLFNFQSNSNIDKVNLAKMTAEKKEAAIEAERMEIYSKAMKVSPEYGATIYKEQCTACHDFEKTVLGPAFNSIIPKYRNNPEEMEKFILNPVKINPDLPAMPDPGLTTLQAKSVTAFILGTNKKSNGEKSE